MSHASLQTKHFPLTNGGLLLQVLLFLDKSDLHIVYKCQPIQKSMIKSTIITNINNYIRSSFLRLPLYLLSNTSNLLTYIKWTVIITIIQVALDITEITIEHK